MGSYAQLKLNGLEIESTKREINPYLMILFRKEDKTSRHCLMSDLGYFLSDDDEDEFITTQEYTSNCTIIKDRLNILGYTLETAKEYFEIAKEIKLQSENKFLHRASLFSDDNEYTIKYNNNYSKKIKYLTSITAEEWAHNIGLIINNKHNLKFLLDNIKNNSNLIYMIEAGSIDTYGHPGYDPRAFIRLAIENINCEESYLTYDLTDLCYEDFENDLDLITYANSLITEDFHRSQKTIILTEGSTDRHIIENSMRILYPHLTDYYRFFDYNNGNVPAGTGNLKNLVKSFSNACIANRVIAIFDNDAAGNEALIDLKKEKIGKNIHISTYPDIDIAKNYPTIGPTGNVHHDINKKACSIELYLGIDTITTNGELTPIEWKSKNTKIGQYQGEIIDKNKIQSKFNERIDACLKDPKLINKYDWSGLYSILNVIFSAFHELDNEEIIQDAIDNII